MTLRLLFIVSSFFVIATSFGQTLKGRVTNAATKDYLEGVEIYIPEIQKKAITDITGTFEMKDVPKGKFKVQFQLDGYKTEIQFIEILHGINIINTKLSANYLDDEQIIVSAPYFKSKNQNTIKIVQINPNQYGAPVARNLSEALAQSEGISNSAYGLSGQKPAIRMQDARRIAIYNNGVQWTSLPWERYSNIGIPYMGIDRIEVIKGPGSLQYGSNALGGVIFIVDEKIPQPFHMEGDVNMLGSYNGNGANTNAGIKFAGEKLFYAIRIGRNDYADLHYDLTGTTNHRINNSRFYQNMANITTGFHNHLLSSKMKLTINNGTFGMISGLGSNDSRIIGGSNRTNNFMNFSHKNTFYIKKTRLNVNYGLHNNDLATSGSLPNAYLNTGNDVDVNWMISFNENSNMIIGTQRRGNNYTNNSFTSVYIPNGSEAENSQFFFINHTDENNKTNIQLGLRRTGNRVNADASSNAFTNVNQLAVADTFAGMSASIGGYVNLSDNAALRINTAMGYRAPSIAELSSNGGMPLSYNNYANSIIELGNPDLEAETSTQIDVAIDFEKENYKFSISGFNYSIDNYIQLHPRGDSLSLDNSGNVYYRYENIDAVIYGFELSGQYTPYKYRWLVLGSNFSYVIGENDAAPGMNTDREYLLNIPAATWKSEIKIFSGKKVAFFDQPYFLLELDHYFARDLGAAFLTYDNMNMINFAMGAKVPVKKEFIEVSITAQNLMDNRNPYPVTLNNNRNLFNPGRNVMLNVKIPFAKNVDPFKRIKVTQAN